LIKKLLKILVFLLILPYSLYSQTLINSVSFEGNDYFSQSELMVSMVSQRDKAFNRNQFLLDLKSIKDKYKEAGYLFASVKKTDLIFASDSSIVDIRILLDEGKKVTIGRINISGNNAIKTPDIIKGFETKKGDVLSGGSLNGDIKDLLAKYENLGLPFVKIKVDEISVYDETTIPKLSISISIDEQERIQIDKIKIKGNEITNDKVILREIKLGKDKKITKENLDDIKARLEKLNIFEKVEDPRIYKVKNSNSAVLLIDVKEGNNNTFDGVLGYVPPANEQDKGYFTGLVNVSFRNLFGTGRRIDGRWSQQIRSTQELEFKYAEPYILNQPLSLSLAFLQRIQDSTYTRRKIDLRGDFFYSDKFTFSLFGGYDRVIPSSDSTRVFLIADSRILYSGVELKYDSRDNIFIPNSGILYRANYSYGDKKIFNASQLGNLGYLDHYSIQRYFSDIEVYFAFFKRQSLLVRLFAGEVKSDKLEDADFFRIGGNKFIRGYREEQFLAARILSGNLEVRYALSRKGFFDAFYDFGYYNKPEDVINKYPSQQGFLFGYGIGLRMETGLGVIGVNYALGKGDGFLDGKINFGIINEF
jgi:outer membrane protein insertion porin family